MHAERHRVLTIAVTSNPSEFEEALPHVRQLRYIRLALGLHPLEAHLLRDAWQQFARNLDQTSYIGEVGLDFSSEGEPTQGEQLDAFRFVLDQLQGRRRFISVHSRRAESEVLDLLEEYAIHPVVFHWYSGSIVQLERLLALGHYCSLNPAMLRSRHGRAIIERLPIDRVLTETDGPFVPVSQRPALPTDVATVEAYLAKQWEQSDSAVRAQLRTNLRQVLPQNSG